MWTCMSSTNWYVYFCVWVTWRGWVVCAETLLLYFAMFSLCCKNDSVQHRINMFTPHIVSPACLMSVLCCVGGCKYFWKVFWDVLRHSHRCVQQKFRGRYVSACGPGEFNMDLWGSLEPAETRNTDIYVYTACLQTHSNTHMYGCIKTDTQIFCGKVLHEAQDVMDVRV